MGGYDRGAYDLERHRAGRRGCDGATNNDINNEGELRFQNSPDYEALNGEPTYDVTVRAEDSQSAAAKLGVTVTVVPTTPREDGSQSPPREGEKLTATLEDDDGIVSVEGWTWERAASATAAAADWTMIAETFDGEPTNRYTPTPADVG